MNIEELITASITEFLDVEDYGRFEAYANRDSLKYQKAYGFARSTGDWRVLVDDLKVEAVAAARSAGRAVIQDLCIFRVHRVLVA